MIKRIAYFMKLDVLSNHLCVFCGPYATGIKGAENQISPTSTSSGRCCAHGVVGSVLQSELRNIHSI